MRGLLFRAVIAGGLVLATMPLAQANPPEHGSAPPPCADSEVICAPPQKVVVECPPPKVIFQQSACSESCTASDAHVRRCCHHCKVPIYVQQVAPAMAVQPMALSTGFVAQPMAMQPFSYAPSFSAVPSYAAQPLTIQSLGIAPSAPALAAQPLTLSIAPSASALTAQPLNLVLQQPAQSAATAEGATKGGADINAAMLKLSASVELLTKVVDKHADLIGSHEKRLKRLEKWLADPNNLKNPLPPLTDADH